MRHVFFVLGISFVAGCAASVESEPLWLSEGKAESVVQAIGSGVAPDLAQPELDLTVPTDTWWMHDATAATVDARIAEGYRLFRLNVASASPLRFSAAFVRNEGLYARNGAGWAHGRTRAQVLAISADPARRIVDVTP
jgi:hypothetical protein